MSAMTPATVGATVTEMAYTPVYGPCTKIILTKSMPFRSETAEEFSSDYTLGVPSPNTPDEWTAICDGLVAREQPIYDNTVTFLRALGYTSNDPHAAHVFEVDWEALGNSQKGFYAGAASEHVGAGDQAACVKWRTDQLSVNGKPIIFKKFHHRPYVDTTRPDELGAFYRAALQTYADELAAFDPPLHSTKYPAAKVIAAGSLEYVTTRTLKRRGKRPKNPG